MIQSLIGANAAIRYLKAFQAHIDYWHELNPTYQLAYIDKPEHTPYIREYAAALPHSMIVARVRHPLDGGFHLAPTGTGDTRHYVSSPAEYHSAYGELGRIPNGILNIFNEPNANGSPDEMMRLNSWMIDYITLATANNTKSVLFNWAAHNPRVINGMMDGQFDNPLRMIAAHPELFYMGLHIYGPNSLSDILAAYVSRCTHLDIKPPRVIATEFGIDSTGGTQRGYKTYPEYKDTYAQWQISAVKGVLKPFIDNEVLVGLCCFQEGNSGGWDDMDTENDQAYKTEIKRAALAGELSITPAEPPPVVTPQPTPLPTPAHVFTPEQIRLLEDMSNTLAADIATATARLVLVNEMLKIAKQNSV